MPPSFALLIQLGDPMIMQFFISSILIVCGATLLVGQTESSQLDWQQFGHCYGWATSEDPTKSTDYYIDWDIEIGKGRSQVVGVGDDLYVLSGEENKVDGKTILKTIVIGLRLADGSKKWTFKTQSTMSSEQETFGGAAATPQATPAIVGNRLVAIDFSGQLICLDRTNGDLVWEKDLVDEFNAAPVQFGFASSPVVDVNFPDRFFVLAAGSDGGFLCLNANDGSTVWKSKLTSPSYATPVSAEFGGVSQWVVVSENEITGIAKSDGAKLWEFLLPESGLTNVPTPLVLDNHHMIVSGQGAKGARCLNVILQDDKWSVDEQWFERKLQFFYTNWLKIDDQIVVGCVDKFLAAINIEDGKILGRWRGYSDGNVLKIGNKLLVLDGKGKLTELELLNLDKKLSGLKVVRKFDLLNTRCWTPMSIVKRRLLVRGGNRLLCLSHEATNSEAAPIENLVTNQETLELESRGDDVPNPVELIFAKFETEGQEAAMALYQKLRSEDALNEAARIELAEAAQAQSLGEVSALIIQQAVEDFPASKEIRSTADKILKRK